ncbi:hypothetical protein [Ammoniphilus sp. 3BR4]|uniref:hypothetical protein n=1 Tax=Ammoniphilus sp. 3BR4 TaxID=3158265 RepID=UPI0034676AEB
MFKSILKTFKYNTEYNIVAICFSVFSLYLISLTLPLTKANINEYMVNARTLLLAVGAGFFGLLGFIVGGFAITSGKMTETLKNQVSRWDYDRPLDGKNIAIQLLIKINEMYSNILNAFQATITIIIFNIIATFISFIITMIPKEFNEILFWLCTSLIIYFFYLAIFYTLSLFKLSMKPLLIDIIENQSEIEGLLDDYKSELEAQEFHSDLREIVMNSIKKKKRN